MQNEKVPEWDTGSAISSLITERERQKVVEGWTPEHDDLHDTGDLAAAAACYALNASKQQTRVTPPHAAWPWSEDWWKPGEPTLLGKRRDLIKAGALIIAEIERIERALGAPDRHPGALGLACGAVADAILHHAHDRSKLSLALLEMAEEIRRGIELARKEDSHAG